MLRIGVVIGAGFVLAGAAMADVPGRCVSGFDPEGNRVPCDYAPAPQAVDPRQQQAYWINENGRAAMRDARYDEALALFQQAYATYPSGTYLENQRVARHAKAIALDRAGNHDAAQRIYEQLLAERNDPNVASNLRQLQFRRAFDRGQSFFSQRSWNEAIDAYETALRYDPGSTASLNNIAAARANRNGDARHAEITHGNALFDEGRFDEAAAAYRRALDVDPSSETAQRNLVLAEERAARARREAEVRAALPTVAAAVNDTLRRKLTKPDVGTAWRQALGADRQGKAAKGASGAETSSGVAREPFDTPTPLPPALGDLASPTLQRVADEPPEAVQARAAYERLDAEQATVDATLKASRDLVQIAVLRGQRDILQSRKNVEIVKYNSYTLRKPRGQGTVGTGGAP